jgi:hypothetical protein
LKSTRRGSCRKCWTPISECHLYGRLSDDVPFYHSEHKPKARTPTPSEVVWTLQKADKTLRCELRDDTRRSAGWDVQVFEDDWLSFAQRCPLESAARFLAASLKRERLREGWTDGHAGE